MHGQENANVIGEGGAVDLTENPSALRRWMVASPELSRMIQEFEGSNNQTEENDHHEQKSGIQKALRRTEYTIFIQELGNPFLEGGGNLMAIHIWDIMDDTVVKTVRNVTKIGEKQSNSFANERLVERSKPVTQPLKKNNLPTFTSTNKKTVSKDKTKVEVLKDDCASFLRLYIACQICDGNAEDFFKYENQLWQPPL